MTTTTRQHGTFRFEGMVWGFEELDDHGLTCFWKIRPVRRIGRLLCVFADALVYGLGLGVLGGSLAGLGMLIGTKI